MEKLEGKIINKSVHDRKRNRSFMVFSLNSFIFHVWYLHFCRYLNVLLYIFFPVFYPPPHVYVILHHDTHCSFLFFVFSFTFSCLIFILLFFSILFWFVKICFFICIFFTSNFSFLTIRNFFICRLISSPLLIDSLYIQISVLPCSISPLLIIIIKFSLGIYM